MVVVGSYDMVRDGDFTHDDGVGALQKACDGRVIDACDELLDTLDAQRAAPLLAKLCDAGDKVSCDRIIEAAANDPQHVFELAMKRCDDGDNDQCGKVDVRCSGQ